MESAGGLGLNKAPEVVAWFVCHRQIVTLYVRIGSKLTVHMNNASLQTPRCRRQSMKRMDIPLDTILETERLRLRAVCDCDVELVWSASRYERFNDGMTWGPPEHKEEIVAVNRHILQAWQAAQDYVFTIDLKNSRTPIGRIGIHAGDDPRSRNIGFWIHPEFSGQGYATEAAGAILDFGAERLGARLFTASHADWNDASRRVLEKLGFMFARENDRGFIKNGSVVAEYEYELCRSRE